MENVEWALLTPDSESWSIYRERVTSERQKPNISYEVGIMSLIRISNGLANNQQVHNSAPTHFQSSSRSITVP